MASIKDTFAKLKTSIVGTTTTNIDNKLDQALTDINSYRNQSGKNGYIDLMKTLISKNVDFVPDVANTGTGLFGSAGSSPANYGQSGRILRYKVYQSIVTNISYCFRALDVLVDNILSPDDITKISLDVKEIKNINDINVQSLTEKTKLLINDIKLEKHLPLIIKETLKFGDFFVEISNSKDVLFTKTILTEESILGQDENRGKQRIKLQEKLIDEKDSKLKIPEILIDYKILENERKEGKKEEKKLTSKDIKLVFHAPQRVVKLQSVAYPICFGYLIFPQSSFTPIEMFQDTTINNICNQILKNLESNIPAMGDFDAPDDLKDVIRLMIQNADPTRALSIRYVPPNKIAHFLVPSYKYYPYGESIYDSAQYTAKVLIALETALAIQRLSRSTEKRKITVDIGLPRDAKKEIESLKEVFRKRKINLDSFGTIDTIACLDLDTEIMLTNGKSMPIGDIVKYFNEGKEFEILAYDKESGTIVPDKVVSAKITGRNVKTIKVILDNNEFVICTPEHLFMMRDGSYKEAKDLILGDSLMPLYTRSSNSTTSKGFTYEEMYQPGLNTWKLTHQVFGKYLGLYENKDVVHHINKNPRDNSSCNLLGCTHTEHAEIHSNDKENGYNGGNIGRTQIRKKINCVICEKEFEKNYWEEKLTCSNECFLIYKKNYSVKSWETRKDQNEYVLHSEKCFICGKEFKITRSLYNKMIDDGLRLVCESKKCKEINKAVRKESCPIFYVECVNCKRNFISEDKNRKACNVFCWNKHIKENGFKQNRVSGKCQNCGKNDIVYSKGFYKTCDNKNCKKITKSLNTTLCKNGNCTLIDFTKCSICGKDTVISKKKSGYTFGTCGIRSCSHKAMHRGIYRNKDLQVLREGVKIEKKIFSNHKVESIEYLNEGRDVADIQTSKYHNFGLKASIFVHNSQISTFEDIYIPTKDGKAFFDVDTFTGGNVDIRSKVDELKFLRDQLVASLSIPPAFLGIEENAIVKATLSEENILFARTIIADQKFISEQINDLIEKIYQIIDPEEYLTAWENIKITLPPPKSLQFEREAKYTNDLVTLVESLERIGIPKSYSVKKYLQNIDWKEIDQIKAEEETEEKLNSKDKDTTGGMGGSGLPPMY